MTIQQWRTICAREINPSMPLTTWNKLVQTISRAEITARKQQEWQERELDPF